MVEMMPVANEGHCMEVAKLPSVIIFVIAQGAQTILSNKHKSDKLWGVWKRQRPAPSSSAACFHLQTAVQTPGNPA